MGMAPREKKETFIAGFPGQALQTGIREMLLRKGDAWLTDGQIDDVANFLISQERFRCRLNRQNRRKQAG